MATDIPHIYHHFSTCYNDDCFIHLSEKQGANYFPKQPKHCECTTPHPPELENFLRTHPGWDPKRTCNKYKNGKRPCDQCDCLVNPIGHEFRCPRNKPKKTPQFQPPFNHDEPLFPRTPTPFPQPPVDQDPARIVQFIDNCETLQEFVDRAREENTTTHLERQRQRDTTPGRLQAMANEPAPLHNLSLRAALQLQEKEHSLAGVSASRGDLMSQTRRQDLATTIGFLVLNLVEELTKPAEL